MKRHFEDVSASSPTPPSTTVASSSSERARQKQRFEPLGLCQECNQARANYRCPGCYWQACSGACLKKHKGSCKDVFQPSAFVPLSQFHDGTLSSDIDLLQHFARATRADTLFVQQQQQLQEQLEKRRHKEQRSKVSASSYAGLSTTLRKVVQAARERHMEVGVMPTGMKRHEQNRSRVLHGGALSWTVELVCPDARLIVDRFDERRTLRELLSNTLNNNDHIDNTTGNRLLFRKWFQDGSKVTCHVLRRPSPAHRRRYHCVAMDVPLRTALQHINVIEFPTLEFASSDAERSAFPTASDTEDKEDDDDDNNDDDDDEESAESSSGEDSN